MNYELRIKNSIEKILREMGIEGEFSINVEIPKDPSHGDYTTNVAFGIAKILKKSPLEIAQEIVTKIQDTKYKIPNTNKVEAIRPGFINFWLSKEYLQKHLENLIQNPEQVGKSNLMEGQKVMIEFAHPNTHKEMHIGHMRTLITGESLSRILASQGAVIFRANYQGDIGPHVARALYGIEKLMQEKNLSLEAVSKWESKDKAHFLGEGYVKGNIEYDKAKTEIDEINNKLYKKDPGHYWDLYQITRKWSLDYYNEFYARFYTKFDRLFMESEMFEKGRELVKKYVGSIFVQDKDGSIIFPGEKYGLHTRVFITQAGNPTYEGKEMENAFLEWEAFHFDRKIHVVASEQSGYFQVVFKALDLIDPKKFKNKQYHLSMGMVQLTDRKMSSRTGDILTVDWLIDQVKAAAEEQFAKEKQVESERESVLEQVSIGAVKYSVLKGGTKQDVAFDIEKSVSLDGDSGVYLQYTNARTNSILGKAGEISYKLDNRDVIFNEEEYLLLRKIVQFDEIVTLAAIQMAPNTIAAYLFDLAKLYNLFYQKYRILQEDKELSDSSLTPNSIQQFRLALTKGVGVVLARGLYLLGIEAPKRM